MNRKLHDFEVTRVAAQAICKRETVRAYLSRPDRMKAATRARVEAALKALAYDIIEQFSPSSGTSQGVGKF